jgi:hypothetical protein
MQRVDYTDFIKPLLRACGLALLTIFLITCAFSAFPFQFLKNPVESLKLMTEFLERSNLLAMALLLILLSLAGYTEFSSEAIRRRQLGWRDRILLKARFLVGLGALFYLAIIPYSLIQAQTLVNMGVRVLDKRAGTVIAPLREVKKKLDSKGTDSVSLPLLKQQYSWINSPQIQSIADLRSRVDSGLKKAESMYVQERSFATKQIYGIVLRICLLAAIHTALIGYFWFYWPRAPRKVKLDGLQLPGLGIEMDDGVAGHGHTEKHAGEYGNAERIP